MDIISFCFSDKWQDWDTAGDSMRSAQITRRLSEHAEVRRLLVINTPTSIGRRLADTVSPPPAEYDIVDGGPMYEVRQVGDEAFVLDHTRLFPREAHLGLCFRANGMLHDGQLRRAIAKTASYLGIKQPVVWLNGPLMSKHIGALDERLSVYDTIDDWAHHPQFRGIRGTLERSLDDVFKRADVIFTSYRLLSDEVPGIADKTVLVPNAFDERLFKPMDYIEPDDIRHLPRPIIGYAGSLQERVDVGVIKRLAEMFPHGTVVLIGRVFDESYFEPVKDMPNVRFLGKKRHDLIPSYVSHFDVAVIPHVLNEFTKSLDPVKLYEYLAMGKPVVASYNPQIESLHGLIDLAADADSFIGYVGRALVSDPAIEKMKKQERIDFASGQTWQTRVDRMVETVGDRLLRSRKGV